MQIRHGNVSIFYAILAMKSGAHSGNEARRRHPKKSRDWVKKQCFPALSNRAWPFAYKTEKQTPDGKPVWLRLAYAGETKIRRHVKIRKNANPFDPQRQ
jgi:RNA-directed DNA polymerase